MPDHPRRAAVASPHRACTGGDGGRAATLAGIAAALIVAVVYRGVLRSYFWGDDLAWLFVLRERGLAEFLLTPMGGHSLVARNAVIALLDAVAGLDPRPWFATVLLTHALNVILLARLVWLCTGSALLGGIGAMAWGTCPAASGTLTWYAVYGQAAATTCLLVVLCRVASRARSGAALSRRDHVLITAGLLLGSVLFGTALAVALVWPIAIALLLPGSIVDRRGLLRALAVPVAVLALYAVLQAVGPRTADAQAAPVQLLDWLARRWWPALVALVQLVRVGVASLLLGAWWMPGARSDVVSWGVVGLAGAVCATAAWRAPGRQRAALAAFLVLAAATYALIAVARGPLAGPLFGKTSAQVAATLRYHYTPQLFLVVAACLTLSGLLPADGRRVRSAVALVWGGALLLGQWRHGVALELHDAGRIEVARALDLLRTSIAAAPAGATAEIPNAALDAFGWLPNTTEKPPGLAGLFVIAFPADVVDGRSVRFVEPDAALRGAAMRRDGRTAHLLIAPPR